MRQVYNYHCEAMIIAPQRHCPVCSERHAEALDQSARYDDSWPGYNEPDEQPIDYEGAD